MASAIDTLDKASRHGMIIRAECACGNLRYFRARDLAMEFGGGRDPRGLPFRCVACKPKMTVTLLELDRDRMPRIEVWTPQRMGPDSRTVWMPQRLK